MQVHITWEPSLLYYNVRSDIVHCCLWWVCVLCTPKYVFLKKGRQQCTMFCAEQCSSELCACPVCSCWISKSLKKEFWRASICSWNLNCDPKSNLFSKDWYPIESSLINLIESLARSSLNRCPNVVTWPRHHFARKRKNIKDKQSSKNKPNLPYFGNHIVITTYFPAILWIKDFLKYWWPAFKRAPRSIFPSSITRFLPCNDSK